MNLDVNLYLIACYMSQELSSIAIEIQYNDKMYNDSMFLQVVHLFNQVSLTFKHTDTI